MSELSQSRRVTVLSFYRFVALSDLEKIRTDLLDLCSENDINGTFILAPEGINATVAGPHEGVEKLLSRLESNGRFSGIRYKTSHDSKSPFHRLKVKLKKELIPTGVDFLSPPRRVGKYVSPEKWNELISDPEMLVLDARNDYEHRVGTFRGAVNPGTDHFREFPSYVDENLDSQKHEKIAMFCTGGIRCEKATAYLLENGFRHVYQLSGGILSYLERIPEKESLWEGECFVFDDRTSVGHGLERGTWTMCRNCRAPISSEDRGSELFREGVSCPDCHGSLTPERILSLEERSRQMKIARQRGIKHLGAEIRRTREAG